ncbi:HlyD family secretion protein [Sphingomonas sp. BK580]|uniref:HlyD family secretion protein n=1 Tax=Sphingomonas sp. BK580 TaxID=2586972 RepID=UPI00161B1A96|nr:efflux RND transporter periplasmic adaptor subunit [Sphingomonas sp. BK580]MBB3695164.1 HlyD family secretion protein [Sphingomonas sp. BK580]
MTDADATTARSRQRLLVAAALVGLLLLVVLGLWLAARPRHEQLQGMVDADEVNVATKALARVDRLLVAEGERVSAGQTLAELSSPEIVGGREQAEGALQAARAIQSETDAGPRGEDVASLRAAWQAALAGAELAAATSRRIESLYAQGVVPAQRRDEAAAARSSSARQAEAARQQYVKALSGSRSQNKAAAAAQVRIARAALGTATALTAETRLTSPIGGEVSRKLVEAGEVVGPVVPAYQVTDVDHPWVSVNVREDRFAGVAIGRVLRGRIPAIARQVDFVVYRISPRADFATWRATREDAGYDIRAFEVRMRPTTRVDRLRPGMTVLFDWPQ